MIIDKFHERSIDRAEDSNFDLNSIKNFFSDLKKQNDLNDFKKWLDDFVKTQTFISQVKKK